MIASIASRTQRRKSTATWSLRERAVCSRPAAGPTISLKPAFDVHMDVLERARERKRPCLDFAFDLGETPRDRLGVGGFDDALAGEHGEMGLGAGDVLGGELAVEFDRGVDLLHRFGRGSSEPAAPHRVAH